MNTDILWANFLSSIKDELSSLSYDTWFSETKLNKIIDDKAFVVVPMPIHKRHLQENYYDLIHDRLFDITGSDYEIEFLLEEELKMEEEKEKIISTKSVEKEFNSNLNKNLNFENFVVGNSNKFAHIGNYIVENSNNKVLYVTCEQFKDDYISIAKKDEDGTNFNYIDFFREKYRSVDVLIIDDIQFLAGSNKTQHEFFNTFNTLHKDNKQIIISSDRSPDDLKNLEDRLRTRFCWGLTVNIYPPDLELRKEILKKKIKTAEFPNEIGEDVIQYMASNIGSNVRQLEGAINRLGAYSAIMGGLPITLDLAIDALKDFTSKGIGENNSIHRIQRIISEYFQISVDDIKSKKRSSNIAFPRQIAMYLCRAMTDESFPKIGIEFGGKDHSTVMHSVEKIENEIKVNKDLANIIEKLKKDIGVV